MASRAPPPGRTGAFDTGGGTIDPVWHDNPGPPYVRGVRVSVPCGECEVETIQVPTTYFRAAAVAASKQLVAAGRLQEGETFRYAVCAYPATESRSRGEPAPGLVVERLEEPVPLGAESLGKFLARGVPYGELHDEDAPVFIPESVLREVVALSHGVCGETGGILVGHLHRDESRPEVFLEITAQIPAAHAQPELSQLTFTPRTWSAADAAVRLRNKNELCVGWWHSHPARQWCDECPEEKRTTCRMTGEFFPRTTSRCTGAVFRGATALRRSSATRTPPG